MSGTIHSCALHFLVVSRQLTEHSSFAFDTSFVLCLSHCSDCIHALQPTNSRATLAYAVRELQIDIEKQLKALDVSDEERSKIRDATKIGIFVVHNK